jgi:hypothetical protein
VRVGRRRMRRVGHRSCGNRIPRNRIPRIVDVDLNDEVVGAGMHFAARGKELAKGGKWMWVVAKLHSS